MKILRQNSAVSVMIGPFVDQSSVTIPETAITMGGQDDVGLIKSNSATTVSLGGRGFTHINSGFYRLELAASDVDTTGPLLVFFRHNTVFQEVWKEFDVVAQNYYDGLHGNASLKVSATTLGSTAVSDSGVTVVYHGSGVTTRWLGATAVSDSGVTMVYTSAGVTVASNTDKTGYSLSADQSSVSIGYVLTGVTTAYQADPFASSGVTVSSGVSNIFNAEIEGGFTLRHMLRIMFSVLSGKSTGGGTASLAYRDTADAKDRLAVTVDADGNRDVVGTRDGA